MFFSEIRPSAFSVGFFDSRCKFKNCTSSNPRECYQYEIEFFTDDGGVAILNGKEYKVQKNHILFARPGDIRMSKMHFRALYLHLLIKDAQMTEYLNIMPSYFGITNSRFYNKALHNLIALRNSADYGDKILFGAEIAKFIINMRKDSVLYGKNAKPAAVISAESYISDNFNEKISLSDIANHVHLSPNYFHKLFTSVTGTSPHDYLMDMRLKYAKELIVTSDLNMMEIAMQSGFSSQSYFNYYFRKKTGLSPVKYKEREFEKYII